MPARRSLPTPKLLRRRANKPKPTTTNPRHIPTNPEVVGEEVDEGAEEGPGDKFAATNAERKEHIVEVNAQKQVLGENSRDFETGDIDIYDAEDAEGDEDGISFTSTYVKWFVELYKVKAKEAK